MAKISSLNLKIFTSLLPVLLFAQDTLGHGVSEADKAAMQAGGFLDFAWLGAKHMLTGYDHLLFIFGVIFFLTRFKEIVKFITVFTVGHSITLIFATFMGITANAYLVDAVIALTVVYKGFDNIDGFRKYLKINPPNMLALVFGFGLIHGFGLSTRLQELPLNHDELLLEIIAFNIGVEGGQIAALTVMMLLLAGWRKTSSFAKFSKVSNIGLIIAGFYLFGMQIDGYMHEHERLHESGDTSHHREEFIPNNKNMHDDHHENQHEHSGKGEGEHHHESAETSEDSGHSHGDEYHEH